ncbi:MAG: MaoC family dehydratase [Phycisphaerales bacterium]|nr:MaoC family dehydratase [Phycisphaerales bacterium]
MKDLQYLDDFAVGQRFGSGHITIDAKEIKRFAAEFDPQPFHMDEQAAEETLFQGLAASGWHTAALSMRLLVESDFRPAGGVIGMGFDEFRWPLPVRPGDTLTIETEILEVRPSKSQPDQGIVKARMSTFNQKHEVVQICVGNLVVKRHKA